MQKDLPFFVDKAEICLMISFLRTAAKKLLSRGRFCLLVCKSVSERKIIENWFWTISLLKLISELRMLTASRQLFWQFRKIQRTREMARKFRNFFKIYGRNRSSIWWIGNVSRNPSADVYQSPTLKLGLQQTHMTSFCLFSLPPTFC